MRFFVRTAQECGGGTEYGKEASERLQGSLKNPFHPGERSRANQPFSIFRGNVFRENPYIIFNGLSVASKKVRFSQECEQIGQGFEPLSQKSGKTLSPIFRPQSFEVEKQLFRRILHRVARGGNFGGGGGAAACEAPSDAASRGGWHGASGGQTRGCLPAR